MAALVGCSARPDPQTLDPVANNQQGAKSIIVFAATDRSPTEAKPSVLGDGRGNITYEQFTMQPVGTTPRGKDGVAALSRNSDPSKDFITTGRRQLDKATFEQSVGRMRKADEMIAVFIHGYNSSYQEAVFRLAQLSADARVVPVLFSWPSMGDFRGYVADRDAATYARDDLVRLLIMLSRSHPSGRIAVVGHSMGGWLVMEALRQLRLEGRNDVIARLQVGLASPDIDIDVFRKQTAVVGRLSPPLTVLVSKDDRALAVSSRLAGGKPRLGLASADDPQIQEIARQSGAQIIDISTLPSSDVFNHDRFVVFASRYATAARRDRSIGGVRHAGVFLLDTTGRILSSPFEGTARIIAGSR
ncbi:alpha/beta hydrolase [Brucella pituitosa]|nr:alpha/beta fold hydrolase [Brucella pituitosa]